MRNIGLHNLHDKRGVALVVSVSIMLVLSTLGVAFARMTTLDRTASSNYSALVDARLAAFAGIDRATTVINEEFKNQGRIRAQIDGDNKALLYPLLNEENSTVQGEPGVFVEVERDVFRASADAQQISFTANGGVSNNRRRALAVDTKGNFSVSEAIGPGRFEEDGVFNSVKIDDPSGKLNVNGHISGAKLALAVNDSTVNDPARIEQVINTNFSDRLVDWNDDLLNGFGTTQRNGAALQFFNNAPLVVNANLDGQITNEVHDGTGKALVFNPTVTVGEGVNIGSNNTIDQQDRVANILSNIVMNRILKELAVNCGFDENLGANPEDSDAQRVADLVRPLTYEPDIVVLDGDRVVKISKLWNSIEELEDTINNAFPGVNADVRTNFVSNLCVDSFLHMGSGVFKNQERAINEPAEFYREIRSPVNVNRATRELIQALLAASKGTLTIYSNFTEDLSNTSDPFTFEKADPVLQQGFLPGGRSFISETKLRVLDFNDQASRDDSFKRGLVEFRLFGENPANSPASRIAREIIRAKVNNNNGEFLDRVQFDATVNGFGNGNLNDFGPLPAIPNEFKVPNAPANDPALIKELTWEKAVQSAIKCLFNPNIMDNFRNPNEQVYHRVSRADLFVNGLDDLGGQIPNTSINRRLLLTQRACIPRHSTDFTFFSNGVVNITSVGRVTSDNGSLVVATAGIDTTLDFHEAVLEHTTQRDFFDSNFFPLSGASNPPATPNVVTTPVNMEIKTDQNQGDANRFAGAVEPRPRRIGNPGNLLFRSPSVFAAGFSGSRVANQAPGRSTLKSMNPNINLVHDGVVSRRIFYDTEPNYFVIPALEAVTINNPGAAGSNPGGSLVRNRADNVLNSANDDTQFNIGNRKGSIGFWLKLDVDLEDMVPLKSGGTDFEGGSGSAQENQTEKDGIPCALIGFTTISEDLQATDLRNIQLAQKDKSFNEGNQLFVYLNTQGQLRVTRIYFGRTFDDNGTEYGTVVTSDADFLRKSPRRDIVVDNVFGGNLNWRAHEWHHLRISWDDTANLGGNGLQVVIDGNNTLGTKTLDEIPKEVNDNLPGRFRRENTFSLLNEREPRDSFFLNGFFRKQTKRGGYFLFNDVVHYVGNITIDDVICLSRNTGFPNPGNRFDNTGLYSNSFANIPSRAVIGPLRWTSYPHEANRRVDLVIADPADPNNNTKSLATTAVGGRQILVPNNETASNLFAGGTLRYRANFTNDVNACATLDSVKVSFLRFYPKTISINFF